METVWRDSKSSPHGSGAASRACFCGGTTPACFRGSVLLARCVSAESQRACVETEKPRRRTKRTSMIAEGRVSASGAGIALVNRHLSTPTLCRHRHDSGAVSPAKNGWRSTDMHDDRRKDADPHLLTADPLPKAAVLAVRESEWNRNVSSTTVRSTDGSRRTAAVTSGIVSRTCIASPTRRGSLIPPDIMRRTLLTMSSWPRPAVTKPATRRAAWRATGTDRAPGLRA